MIKIIKYTVDEKKALEAIEEKYRPELTRAYAAVNELDSETQLSEYLTASERVSDIHAQIQAEREVYYKRAEMRALDGFSGDVERIVNAVKGQVLTFIYVSKALAGEPPTAEERAQKAEHQEGLKRAIERNKKLIATNPSNEEIIKSTQELEEMDVSSLYDSMYSAKGLRDRINESFSIYFDFLQKTDTQAYAELQAYIDEAIECRDEIEPAEDNEAEADELASIITKYPQSYIAPTDKISSLAFSGELNAQLQQLAMERRGSKKQITTLVSIDFEKLNGAVQIRGRKELTAYDREVHDAIITLFVDGGNEYITPQMIYQAMTGNPKAYLNPKQAEAISDSITKCMYSRVIINADEEAKAYGFEKFKYDGSLISGERVTATLNGNVLECLHLLRKPILYEYADKKNQIGRFDIKLLNSPINKTEEIITLQGYLYRRILSMKGSSTLSKTIVYETVYNQIGVEASSDGALRKKKNKVRGQIKSILDFWKQEGFILGYCENKRKTELYSVTIRV